MMQTNSNRRRLIPALAIAVASACLAIATASAAPPAPSDVLPDLVADPVADVVLSTDASGSSNRLLLRFAGFVHNTGQGAVEIRGARSSSSAAMSVLQRVFDSSGGWRDVASPAQLDYEQNDGHRHWHLRHAARYSLWNSSRSAEVAPAMKVGFCLEDSERVDSGASRTRVYGGTRDHRFCEWDNPYALSVFQGVSAGWRDVYHNELAFQWVDVSDVQPGIYWLRTDVDPDGVVLESGEVNQAAWGLSQQTVPGYVAQPLDAGETAAATPLSVTLGAQRFGATVAAQYRIESGPAHGTLDVAPGSWTSSPVVSYRPEPGYSGTDSFTYSARDSGSDFPRSPATATVNVRVAAAPVPAVAISGAPDALITGTSAQLTAAVTNDSPTVSWTVDGAAGGSAAAGTISPSGLYRAPDAVPAAGAVTIAARSAGGGYDERRVRITAPPVPQPAPLPTGAVLPAPQVAGKTPPVKRRPKVRLKRNRFTALRVGRIHRQLVMTATPARSGLVRITAYAGGLKIGSCSARASARMQFTCRLWIQSPLKVTAKIRVVASLRVKGRVVAFKKRRAAVVRPSPHRH